MSGVNSPSRQLFMCLCSDKVIGVVLNYLYVFSCVLSFCRVSHTYMRFVNIIHIRILRITTILHSVVCAISRSVKQWHFSPPDSTIKWLLRSSRVRIPRLSCAILVIDLSNGSLVHPTQQVKDCCDRPGSVFLGYPARS